MIRRVLPLLLLLALPAAATLVPGPEKPASTPAVAATPRHEVPLAIATDGKDFLALWTRNYWGYESMYAAKVTETGAVSPMPARRVTTGSLQTASLVWTGDAYLAIWTAQSSVVAARLDRDANVIAEPFVIANGSSVHALAWDGRRAMAIANDDLGMKVLVMGPDGNLVRTNRVPERVAGDVRLLAGGGGFVVVWTANFRDGVATVYALQLSRDGDAGTKVKLPFPTSSGVYLDAEIDGGEIGIAFTEWPGAVWSALRPLRRYTLDANTLACIEHPVARAALGPEVVATPGGFVSVVLNAQPTTATLDAIPFDSTDTHANRVPPLFPQRPLIASNGRSVLAIWSQDYVAGALFDAMLTRLETPPFAISTSLVSQRMPELAPAGDVALHAWFEETSAGGQLVVARVDRNGHALDAPRVIGHGQFGGIGAGADVVFAGKLWLVAYWSPSGDEFLHLFVRRVALDGVPLDEAPLDFGPTTGAAMASNGDVTLLAVLGPNGTEVHRFIDGGLRTFPPTATLPIFLVASMASNGREFLLVDHGLRALRFDASGFPIDVTPSYVDSVPIPEGVTVTSDGTDYFVAYGRSGRIVVRRVRPTGDVEGETLFGAGVSPRIAFLGTRPIVAYLTAPGPEPPRLYLQEPGGEPLLVAESAGFLEHTLASRGGALWLSCARVPDPQEGFGRVFVRTVDETPPARRRPARK